MTKRLLVMAGGTGGHVFPAIAVANVLQQQGWQVEWLGTKDRMEAQLVPKHGIAIHFIEISGLRGKGIKALLTAPFKILRAILQARKVIKNYQPDAVLGMGGYVSGPGGVAAKLAGVPIILHEQNAVAGLTNKWLAKIATRVLQAFPTAFADAEVVGNPVRADLFALPTPQQRFSQREGALRILVVGGSQGARVLNLLMPKVAAQLTKDVVIRHQAGKGNSEAIKALYPQNIKVNVSDFIDDMAAAYAWADVVVCRAGATTVSELTAGGIPALLVPFVVSTTQHQLGNAKYLEAHQAGVYIDQKVLSAQSLFEKLNSLDRDALIEMAENARKLSHRDAAKTVADQIERLVAK